jgi:hypothetical protein
MSYPTECAMHAAGVSLLHLDNCDESCNVDGDCAPPQLCCYPCGVPGCKNKCTMPVGGACPKVP